MSVVLSKRVLEKWCSNRKLLFSDIANELTVSDDRIILSSFDKVERLSRILAVPVAELFHDSDQNDLDNGVKLCRRDQGYRRVSERNGDKYYTYQHLVTTSACPNLMPLHVTLHCNDEDKIVLNDGHYSHEMIFVTRGKVRMHWNTEQGLKKTDLNEGDSAYLHPGISHSFMAITNGSEIIAINF